MSIVELIKRFVVEFQKKNVIYIILLGILFIYLLFVILSLQRLMFRVERPRYYKFVKKFPILTCLQIVNEEIWKKKQNCE